MGIVYRAPAFKGHLVLQVRATKSSATCDMWLQAREEFFRVKKVVEKKKVKMVRRLQTSVA